MEAVLGGCSGDDAGMGVVFRACSSSEGCAKRFSPGEEAWDVYAGCSPRIDAYGLVAEHRGGLEVLLSPYVLAGDISAGAVDDH